MAKVNLTEVFDKLPESCAVLVKSTNHVGLIYKGQMGYTHIQGASIDLIDQYNAENGIDKATQKAMEVGSLCGWTVPGIDPNNYRNQYHG